jgi:predicted enzyme related to lactoylglutathione lyase
MAESDGNPSAAPGKVLWVDLTVADAEGVRDFYAAVTGWRPEPVDMGGYADFNMMPPGGGDPAAGICHRRGSNAGLPAQWLVYVAVADVEESARRCAERGGKVVDGPRPIGGKKFCVIQDPAGAVAALIEA